MCSSDLFCACFPSPSDAWLSLSTFWAIPPCGSLSPNTSKRDIVACGTAYHAGLVGKNTIEKLAGIPCEVDVASEFRYRDPFMNEHTLFIAISQSGETSDTLAALREAKRRGARVLSVVNVVGSSVAHESDDVSALEYVRFRHDPLGDIGRVQRQQKFMDIVLAKLKSPSILPVSLPLSTRSCPLSTPTSRRSRP